MALPPKLQAGIDREVEQVDRSRLAKASAQITDYYKRGRFRGSLHSPELRAAYLLTRLPATYAANCYVFDKIARQMPDLNPQSLLDLGAGPGTAMWAARETWANLSRFTLIENNDNFLRLGQKLADDPSVKWLAHDLETVNDFSAHDLVVLSYSLGELNSPRSLVSKAWQAAQQALIIIEPGTPRNFSVIADIRKLLIESGAHPIAPCPHTNECPMAAEGDWCHFATRVARTSEHRRLKSGTLGYEDEKFSYLAFSKMPAPHSAARIVRHPEIHGGHIRLALCTATGFMQQTITRSDKPAFRAARQVEWGDPWPATQLE